MTGYHYALREFAFRRTRSAVTVASVAFAILAAVLLTALANSYGRAIRTPIETVGADVIVQITGDVPPKLEGLVFPHPNALVPKAAVAEISRMAGVISLTRAVYLWELAPDRYQSVLGIADGEVGLGGLGRRLIAGKPLAAGDRTVLVDSDFATKNTLSVGAALEVGGTAFPVTGIVDAARGGKVVRADVYMPLAVAQALAAAAPQVTALYPFAPDDANLLLVKVDRQHLESVVGKIGTLLGKKGLVSSELSFREAISGVLFLSERMGTIVAAVIGFFAAAFVLRATASAIAERRRELAVLAAIGWSARRIRGQMLRENALLAIAGAILGLVLTFVLIAAVGGVSVTVELPWDLSATPHFIPDAMIDRSQTVTAPMEIPWAVSAIAGAGSIVIALIAAFAVLVSSRPQPWSLLHSE